MASSSLWQGQHTSPLASPGYSTVHAVSGEGPTDAVARTALRKADGLIEAARRRLRDLHTQITDADVAAASFSASVTSPTSLSAGLALDADQHEPPPGVADDVWHFVQRLRRDRRRIIGQADGIPVVQVAVADSDSDAAPWEVDAIVQKRSMGYNHDPPVPTDTDLGVHRRDDPLFLAHWQPSITRVPRSPRSKRKSGGEQSLARSGSGLLA